MHICMFILHLTMEENVKCMNFFVCVSLVGKCNSVKDKKSQCSSFDSTSLSLVRPPVNNLVKLTLETSTKPSILLNCVREGSVNNS